MRVAAAKEYRWNADRAALSQILWRRVLLVSVLLVSTVACVCLVSVGCGSAPAPTPAPAENSAAAAQSKPAAPAVPPEIESAARSLLGSEATVLVFGDLARNGNQQFLAVNVLPKTPTNTIPGTVITRASIAENANGKWMELLHCDEHLKNERGYLALTPRDRISAWRLQFEQDRVKGLQVYFTPEKTGDAHVLPIGVGYNPKVKRYQSLDRSFEKYLPEVASMSDTPRATLR